MESFCVISLLKFLLFVLYVNNNFEVVHGEIPNVRKCADELCEVRISQARTTQNYLSPENGVLNFKIDEIASIYSKEAGSESSLWGVEINGRKGYVPKKFVREEKIFVKDDLLTHLVPTLILKKDNTSQQETPAIKDKKEDAPVGSEETVTESVLNEVPRKESVPEQSSSNENNIADTGEVKSDSLQSESIPDKQTVDNNYKDVSSNARGDSGKTGLDPLMNQQNAQTNVANEKIVGKLESNLHHKIDENLINENEDASNLDSVSEKNKEIQDESIKENNGGSVLQDEDLGTDEEVDNEDEGNGNEGEENGSEYKVGDNEKRENNKDLTPMVDESLSISPEDLTAQVADTEPELLVENATPAESPFNSGAKITVGLPSMSASVPEGDKSSTGSAIKNYPDKNHMKYSEDSLPQPTPAQEYEVIDGTTFYQNDAEENHEAFSHSTFLPPLPPFPLQASQYSSEVVHTTQSASFGVPHTDNIHIATEKPNLLNGNINYPDSSEISSQSDNINPSGIPEAVQLTNIVPTTATFLDNISEHNTDGVNTQGIENSKMEENSGITGKTVVKDNSDEKNSVLEDGTTPEYTMKMELDTADSSSDLYFGSENKENLKIESQFSTPKPESLIDDGLLEVPEVVTSEPIIESEVVGGFFSSFMSSALGVLKGNAQDEAINSIHDKVDESIVPDQAGENVAHDQAKPVVHDQMSENIVHDQAGDKAVEPQQEILDESGKIIANIPFTDPFGKKPEAFSLFSDDSVTTNNLTVGTNEVDAIEKGSDGQSEQHTSDDSFQISSPHDKPVEKSSNEKSSVVEMSSITEQIFNSSRSLLKGFLELFQLSDNMAVAIEDEIANLHFSAGTATFLIIVSATIILLYFLHLIMVKVSRETPLLEAMNLLDRNQRILSEENNNLKRKLTNSNGQIKATLSTRDDPSQVKKLKDEIKSIQTDNTLVIEQLKERIQQLEIDLESSTANEVDLHRMLSELLSSQKETTSFEDSVNKLQAMLDGQREKVESLTSDLAMKTRMNDELRNELKLTKSRENKLEYQIEQLSHTLEEVNSSKLEYIKRIEEEENCLASLREINEALMKQSEESTIKFEAVCDKSEKLKETVKKLKERLNNQEAECQVLKECLKKIKISSEDGGNVNGKLAELFKIVDVKSQLITSEKERLRLVEKLRESEDKHNNITKALGHNQDEVNQLQETLNKMKSERDDAKSKLEVLTQYYEEKEAQLKKELESQEGLRQDAEGSVTSVASKIQGYKAELVSCRSQIESLKHELEEQTQSHKMQMTNEEKKLQDSWLSARSAERRQEELRQENSQLRQLLTQMQRETENQHIIKPAIKRMDVNGSVSSPISIDGELDGLHSPPTTLPLDWGGSMPPPIPPQLLPMFQGRPPHMAPGLPHQPPLPPPPSHPGLPPHPFLAHLPPPPPHHLPDRRLPPAGRIASPPGYDRRSYSPSSDHSHYSDRYSPGPRYSPGGGQRIHSPDRRNERSRRAATSNYRRRDQRSPSPVDRIDRHSPNRWYTQSPPGLNKNRRSSPHGYYGDGMDDSKRMVSNPMKGKKTSTPLGPNDR